jgi:hypothetical protein
MKILSTTKFQQKIHQLNTLVGEEFVIVHIRTGKILGAVRVIEAPQEVHGSVDDLTFRKAEK